MRQGLLLIDGATVESLVTLSEAISVTEAALRKTADGRAHQDIRRTLALPGEPGTCLSLMYAAPDDQPLFGAKVQSVFPHNFHHGRPSHQGCVMLFERSHGLPVALINASAITGLRTPASSAVATRTLGRADAAELAVIGYGEQASRHIAAISLVRPLSRIRVWGRDPTKVRAFAQTQSTRGFPTHAMPTAQAAVDSADIVCTVTSSSKPVLSGDWINPGTHINAVGASVAALREIDLTCVLRSHIWVDYMALAMTSASDIFEPLAKGLIPEGQLMGEIGAVPNGTRPGRRDAHQITLYRSLGVPAQDVELGNFIYHKAKSLGFGSEVFF